MCVCVFVRGFSRITISLLSFDMLVAFARICISHIFLFQLHMRSTVAFDRFFIIIVVVVEQYYKIDSDTNYSMYA